MELSFSNAFEIPIDPDIEKEVRVFDSLQQLSNLSIDKVVDSIISTFPFENIEKYVINQINIYYKSNTCERNKIIDLVRELSKKWPNSDFYEMTKSYPLLDIIYHLCEIGFFGEDVNKICVLFPGYYFGDFRKVTFAMLYTNVKKRQKMLSSDKKEIVQSLIKYQAIGVAKIIKDDDVEHFIKESANYRAQLDERIEIIYDFDNLSNLRLIDVSALYGSVKVFKYLLLNGQKILDSTVKCAILSNNIEVIRLCQQNGGNFNGSLNEVIETGNVEMFNWLLMNYQLDFDRINWVFLASSSPRILMFVLLNNIFPNLEQINKAINSTNTDSAIVMLKYFPDVTTEPTLLWNAFLYRRYKIFEKLCKLGANQSKVLEMLPVVNGVAGEELRSYCYHTMNIH